MNQTIPFILASASPRRRELLAMCGFSFSVRPACADESLPAGVAPDAACMLLARRKAAAARQEDDGALIVAADTIVYYQGKLLGKPASEEEAIRMLTLLSGQTHQVYTGVCLMQGAREDTFFAVTSVSFLPLSEADILSYVQTGEPMDKAGGYGIQGRGALFVSGIQGDYYNVVGFPLSQFNQRLRCFTG